MAGALPTTVTSGIFTGAVGKACIPVIRNQRLPGSILVESIIDAVSIVQQHELTIQYEVLALYGTNGLTDEHCRAIVVLKHLEEIILMLNGDEAGKAATVKHCTTLHALLPTVKLTTVAVPDGEDVNSLLQTHDDPRVLTELIEGRTPFSFSIEPPASEPVKSPVCCDSKTRDWSTDHGQPGVAGL